MLFNDITELDKQKLSELQYTFLQEIILKNRPKTPLYVSFKDVIAAKEEYDTVVKDFCEEYCRREKDNPIFGDGVFYDTKTNELWVTENVFKQYKFVFYGFISETVYNEAISLFERLNTFIEGLYEKGNEIRALSKKELNERIKNCDKEDKMLYIWAKKSRNRLIKATYENGYAKELAKVNAIQQKGAEEIKTIAKKK